MATTGAGARGLVIHDRQGTVLALVTMPPEAPPVALAARSGELATEVDLSQAPIDPSTIEDEERAVQALRGLRIEVATQARLVSRGSQ